MRARAAGGEVVMDDDAAFVNTGNIQVAPDDGSDHCVHYEVELEILVRHGGVERPRVAINVSGEGVFAESIDHLPIGELVQVVAVLPGGELSVLATVERVVLSEEAAFVGGIPGLGLRFLLMDRGLRRRWAAYLLEAELSGKALPGDPEAAEHRKEKALRLSRRDKHQQRRAGRLAVRIESEEKLVAFYTRNVSKTGMFIPTAEPLEPGTKLSLFVDHPVSGRALPLAGEVRWTCTDGPESKQGMGVMLMLAEDGDDDAFLRFVNQG
jgi:Tfp pilus assembly protein PilZ